MELIKPTVHLNGTSRDALFEANVEAAGAIRRALAKLRDAAPNARDFYPQGPDAFATAQRQHNARAESLRAVLKDLESICEHLSEDAAEVIR